jgi:TolA-binding protein
MMGRLVARRSAKPRHEPPDAGQGAARPWSSLLRQPPRIKRGGSMWHLTSLRPYLLGLITWLSLASVAAGQDGAADLAATRLYNSGTGFLNREMYDLAVQEYQRFLEQHAGHEKAPLARYGLAVALSRLERHAEARDLLAKWRPPSNFEFAVESRLLLGQCQMALAAFEGAAGILAEVARDHPDHALADQVLALQAEALYRAGRHAEVAAPAEALIARWPQSAQRERSELILGLAAIASGQDEMAAARLAGLLERFPDGEHAEQARLLLAQSLHRGGALKPAAARYLEVIQDGSAAFRPDALYGLALLEHQEGRLDQAGELVDRLLAEHSEHGLRFDALMLRARISFDDEAYERAAAVFEQAAGAPEPRPDEVQYWLAKCDLRRGEPARSAQRLAAVAEQFPRSELLPLILYDRAVALLRGDDLDAALASLSAFHTRFATHELDPEVLRLMAHTEHRQRRYDRSQALCREFLARHAGHAAAAAVRFLVGENEYLHGRHAEAVTAYQEFLERHADDEQAPIARFRQGMALHAMGDFERARPLLESASARSEPIFRPALLALGDGHFQRGDLAAAHGFLQRFVDGGAEQDGADDALLKLGLCRLRQGQPAEGLAAFDALLERLPESPHRLQALFERGQALVQMEELDPAAAAFEVALKEGGPRSRFAVHALNHLAAIDMRQGRFAAAVARYDQVAAADAPAELAAEAIFQKGQALTAAGRYEDAADAFARLRKAHPKAARAPEALARRAIALSRAAAHEAALGEIALAEKTAGIEAELLSAVLYEKAWCLRGLDRPDDAASAYRAILERPENRPLRRHAALELAELDAAAGRNQPAMEILLALLQENDLPGDIDERARYRAGACAYALERYSEAAAELEVFLERYPNGQSAASGRLICGESLVQMGEYQRALTHLKVVVEKHAAHDSFGPALLRLGECQAQLQDYAASEGSFRRYLKEFPGSELAYQAEFGIGWALENRGRHDDAIAAYQKLVQSHQGQTAARAQFQIGECLFAQKRYEDAVRELLKVDILYAYPQWSAAALYEAGRCFEELSNPVDARRQFQQVVEKFDTTSWARLAAKRLEALARSGLPGRDD